MGEFADAWFRGDETRLWSYRMVGKPSFYTPEQFTDEWEYAASLGMAELTREETAGNYQWWTNLFQAGLVMWCLVTGCYPADPPAPSRYAYQDDDGGAGGGPMSFGYSYGVLLFSDGFSGVDRELRNLIVRCLDHNPWERPGMRYLEWFIADNVGRADLRAVESDEELLRNARRIFGGPP